MTDRPRFPLAHVGRGCSLDRRRVSGPPTFLNPGLDLCQIPNDASGRQKKRRGNSARCSISWMVVLANGTILRNSGRRTVRLKSKDDDGMNPWIQPRPSNGASFASRNTSLAEVGAFSFFWAHDAILVDTAAFDVKLRLGKTKGKHHDICVRRSDTYSEENGTVRSIATYRAWRLRISGFDDPEPVFVASPAASTKADIGPLAFISNVGSPAPARTWTYRVGIVGTRSNTASTILRWGPARRRWQHAARNALSAVGWPTF